MKHKRIGMHVEFEYSAILKQIYVTGFKCSTVSFSAIQCFPEKKLHRVVDATLTDLSGHDKRKEVLSSYSETENQLGYLIGPVLTIERHRHEC